MGYVDNLRWATMPRGTKVEYHGLQEMLFVRAEFMHSLSNLLIPLPSCAHNISLLSYAGDH